MGSFPSVVSAHPLGRAPATLTGFAAVSFCISGQKKVGRVTVIDVRRRNVTCNDIHRAEKDFADAIQSVEHLSLAHNKLTSLPFRRKGRSAWTSLTSLDLSGNSTLLYYVGLDTLKGLKELNLSSNNIPRFPQSVTQLPNLERLDMSRNRLSDIPPSITQLMNLTELDLTKNNLSSLPATFCELKALNKLQLSFNNFMSFPPSSAEMEDAAARFARKPAAALSEMTPGPTPRRSQSLHDSPLGERRRWDHSLPRPPALSTQRNNSLPTNVDTVQERKATVRTLELAKVPPTRAPLRTASSSSDEEIPANGGSRKALAFTVDSPHGPVPGESGLWQNSGLLPAPQKSVLRSSPPESPQVPVSMETPEQKTPNGPWMLSGNGGSGSSLPDLGPPRAARTGMDGMRYISLPFVGSASTFRDEHKHKSSLGSSTDTSSPRFFPSAGTLSPRSAISRSSVHLNQPRPGDGTEVELPPNLTYLDISHNSVFFIDESCSSLNALSYLDISFNKITFVPDALSCLGNLKHLDLSFNMLDAVNDSALRLPSLVLLALNNNSLRHPPNFDFCTALEYVSLSANFLSVCPDFSGLDHLERLGLCSNSLTQVPPLPRVPCLKVLDLSHNRITNFIVAQLYNQTELDYLRVQGNNIEIPAIVFKANPQVLLEYLGGRDEERRQLEKKLENEAKAALEKDPREMSRRFIEDKMGVRRRKKTSRRNDPSRAKN